MTGPRFLDPHQSTRIQDSSTKKYRRALMPFIAHLVDHGFCPATSLEFDDLIVEFKNDQRITKSHMENLVAAVEHVLPTFKGQLVWSHTVLSSWSATYVTEHTVPMCALPAAYIAAHMAADGHPRLGASLILQQALGLRPSEILGVQANDAVMPEHASFTNSSFATIGLGVRTNTKAKRAQCVLLHSSKLLALLRWLLQSTTDDSLLCGYSYAQYRRILDRTTSKLGLSLIIFFPHSPRSGFATELYAQGVPFERIKSLGRWSSDQSLKTYLDLVSASNIAVSLKLQFLQEPMTWCAANMLDFFAGAKELEKPAPPLANAASVDGQGLDQTGEGHLAFTCRESDGARVAACDAEAFLDPAASDSEVRCRDRGRGDRRLGRRRSSSLKGDRRRAALDQEGGQGRGCLRGRGRGRR